MTPDEKQHIKELLKADFRERLRRVQEQLHYEYRAFPEAREENDAQVNGARYKS